MTTTNLQLRIEQLEQALRWERENGLRLYLELENLKAELCNRRILDPKPQQEFQAFFAVD